ncbi:MAG: metallophosphoesterase, partial [Desulfurococcales archaeon]|nr:metallophosphoesterase [Desulfurococcales archaeon]
MKSRYVIIPLLVLLILQTAYFSAIAENNEPLGWENPLPTTDPMTSFVAYVQPGSTAVFHLRDPNLTVENLSIFTVYYTIDGGTASLHVYNQTVSFTQNGTTLIVDIPYDAPPTVYDVILVSNQGIYRLPQVLWIQNSCPDKIRLIHMTDQHYDLNPGYVESGFMLGKLLGADVYFGTGDSTDTATEEQAKHYVQDRSMLLYGVPAFENPGNHDHESDQAGAKYFRKYIAPEVWYRVICDKYLFIGLNTGKDRRVITQEQLDFLQDILQQYSDIPVKIIGYHHPFFWHDGNLTSTYNDPGITDYLSTGFWYGRNANISLEFLKLVEEYNVTLTLQGHVHSDSIVKFTSTWTNHTTYFVTTTTTGGPHAREVYNGVQIMDIYENNTVTFPFAPPTFDIPIVHGVNRGYFKLAIPVQTSYQYHFNAFRYANDNYTANALFFDNSLYFDINAQYKIIRFPWGGGTPQFYINTSGNASIQVVDWLMPGDGYIYLLLNIYLPQGSTGSLIVSSIPDNNPPQIEYTMSIPPTPNPGQRATFYFQISDHEWGLKDISAMLYTPTETDTISLVVSGNYYMASFNVPENGTLTITATDVAGHTANFSLYFINGEISLTPPAPSGGGNQTNQTQPGGTTNQTTGGGTSNQTNQTTGG